MPGDPPPTTVPYPAVKHAVWLLPLLGLLACSRGSDLAPVGPLADAGADAADAEAGPDADAGLDADASDDAGGLGKPCVADVDCGDDVDCTLDQCDQGQGRCRNTPDDSKCADSSACNGSEICDVALGCRTGEPITCSDGDACTIDKCVEGPEGVSCSRIPRDVDGDGDPDHNCKGGDCNDGDPAVSSLRAEICANLRDDNCDGQVDEAGCVQPQHDTCSDPLILSVPGTYALPMAGAKLDTSSTCAPVAIATLRDVVVGIQVPEGPPQSLDVKVSWPYGSNAASLGEQCGVAEDELACAVSLPNTTAGGQIARLRAHSLAAGTYPLLVYASQDVEASVSYELREATTPPTNETCGTAEALTPGEPRLVPLVGARADVAMVCGSVQYPDLVYKVTLDQPYDVRAFASTLDGIGNAVVSIRKDPCAEPADEISCAFGSPAAGFVRKLGPGDIYVAVASSSGGDVDLLVTLAPPTDPPPDESCNSGPPVLQANQTRTLDLTDHTDDHAFCASALPDAAFALPLTETSDVLLVLRTSIATSGALSLARPPCDPATDLLSCKGFTPSPIRVGMHGVEPGAYRVVAELSDPTPAALTALVRKAVAPVLVPFADSCDDAFTIPPEGGSFQGNTANVNAQYTASCDQGGATNARDQILRLELAEKRRVVLDMNGSAYSTLIDVRKGPQCPGEEVSLACTIGTLPQRSFLDLTLDAGVYFLQIDGFNGASGAWFLDVFVTAP